MHLGEAAMVAVQRGGTVGVIGLEEGVAQLLGGVVAGLADEVAAFAGHLGRDIGQGMRHQRARRAGEEQVP